jgi:hypothetical protein
MRDSAMLFVPDEDLLLADLRQQLRQSQTATFELMDDVIARASLRSKTIRHDEGSCGSSKSSESRLS